MIKSAGAQHATADGWMAIMEKERNRRKEKLRKVQWCEKQKGLIKCKTKRQRSSPVLCSGVAKGRAAVYSHVPNVYCNKVLN